jgi:hypothetical protein
VDAVAEEEDMAVDTMMVGSLKMCFFLDYISVCLHTCCILKSDGGGYGGGRGGGGGGGYDGGKY